VLNAGLVPPNTWKKDIRSQTGQDNINSKLNYYRGLIDKAKEEETRNI